jgi:4-amino-4-deoxy-L-arabinose transferase-like glycosyltransferase
MPVSADEAYYWVWSRALAPGYLDHPPMVALWIRAGTALAGQTALGIRLLGPLSAAAGTWLLALAAEDLAPGKGAGLAAASLLNGTVLLNAGAVTMTPDTPLLFFWTAALFCLARLLRTGRAAWWLGVGLAGGLALDSKYTGLLLGAALAVWLAAIPGARHWWRCWQLWAGAALALTLFAPVLFWNAAHHWVSFAKQGGRGEAWAPAQSPRFLAELLAGQIGLATPVILVGFGVGLRKLAADGAWRAPANGLLICVVGVPALVLLQHALGGRVQANWPSVLYPGAALAAGCAGIGFWRIAAWSGLALTAPLYAQAAYAPLALPRKLDFTLIRLAGWNDLAGAAYVAATSRHAGFVAADEYGLASELAFRLHSPVLGVEPRWQYFALGHGPLPGAAGILVRSQRRAGAPDPRIWPGATRLGDIRRQRNGVVAETYTVYGVQAPRSGFATLPETASLPPR